jgi:hypothetical protein
MRATVLKDAALVKQARQFVWLSIDSDKPENEKFTAEFATGGVPLYVLIDPASGKAVLSWYGTATAQQLARLMEDGTRAMAGGLTGAEAWLAHADELNAQKKPGEAAGLYQQALLAGGADWPHRTRTIESLVMAYEMAGNQAACRDAALREAPGMARDRSFVNTVYFGLECAPTGTPEQLRQMEKLAEEGVRIPGVLADDTSGLYQNLAMTYRRTKDEDAATRTAMAWLQYLQQQIAQAPDAEARMGYLFHLASAAVFLHQPKLALAGVERAERELPNDYNPTRVAANIYQQMGRHDEALAACDRAMRKAYGAPKASLYLTKGRILESQGDVAGARAVYAAGMAFARTLPEAMSKGVLAALENASAEAGKKR